MIANRPHVIVVYASMVTTHSHANANPAILAIYVKRKSMNVIRTHVNLVVVAKILLVATNVVVNLEHLAKIVKLM